MNLYQKYKHLQIISIINLFVLSILIIAILSLTIIYYVRLPDYSPIRQKLKIGKYISIFELDGLFYNYRNLGLPIYELDITQKNLQKIYGNLPPADSIITDEYKKYVPAAFRFKDKKYKVKLRIRGLAPNHWRDKKKSWRIKFASQDLFNGIKNIDLIIPQDRAYISEHLNNYIAKKMGLFVPDSQFVFLMINGKFQGVYFQIEHPGGARFLEYHHRADNANFYGDSSWNWFKFGFPPIFSNIGHWEKDASERVSAINNYTDLHYLLELLNKADDKQFYSAISNILDIDKFLTWQSHSMLAGSYHQGGYTNVNLYFDSISGKFEPLPWDVDIWPLEDLFFDKPYNPLVDRILKFPEFRHRRNTILWSYVSNSQNLEDDLNFYERTYKEVKPAFYVDKNKGFSNLRFRKEIERYKTIIINNRKKIKDNLSSTALFVTAQFESDNIDLSNKLRALVTLDITNHGFSAAMLEKIKFRLNSKYKNIGPIDLFFDNNNSGILDEGDLQIANFRIGSNNDEYITRDRIERLLYSERDEQLKPVAKNYRFFVVTALAVSDIEILDLQVAARNAVTRQAIEPKYRYVDKRLFSRFAEIAQSADEFDKQYNLFSRSDKSTNKFIITSGEHLIKKTIIVPKGLQILIQPGAILKFAPGVSLISYSPMECFGNKDEPIVFTALEQDRPWGVFAVVGTGAARNIFRNIIAEYGGEAFINGIYFTGALAIHAADARIDNCVFRYNQGDDAINIKQGEGIINNSIFNKNASDAIDYDFASGIIKNNEFIKNNGDGIDLCNSHIAIVSNHIKQSGDKGISVGEESNPLIINNLVHSCTIGIAIKDNSNPQIINDTIVNNGIGIKSFMKKGVFGGAQGKAKNIIIWGNNTSIEMDNLSSLRVSDSLIQGGYQGKNILDSQPIFIDPKQENYLLGEPSKNQLLLKGTCDRYIEKLFPEFKDMPTPMGVLFLPKIDFSQKSVRQTSR